jgi:abequosyltransferase
MVANPLISITIPTYNRAEFLDRCLAHHIPLAKAHKIQIIVSDNASTDDTELVVKKRMADYPFLRYSRNGTNLGADKNFEQALKIAETEYIWLLGDTYKIPSEGISYFFEIISKSKQDYDALIFNVRNRVLDVPAQDYNDRNKLLSDLGWHMTCLASLVYNSKVVKSADFERYKNTDLVQTGIIFDYIGNREFLIHWKENISIQAITVEGIKKASWQSRTFEIWTERWSNLVFSLPPSYRLDVKLKCIKDHGIKSGLFSLKSLLFLRGCNALNRKIYKKYSIYFPLTISYSKLTILLISLFPQTIAKVIVLLYQFAKKEVYSG